MSLSSFLYKTNFSTSGLRAMSFCVKAKMDPILTIKQGKLKGSQLRLPDNSTYYSFKGIQYAQVPARFMAPTPPKSWQGIYNATKHGPICTQYDMTTGQMLSGDENCLFLNVYTKSLSKSDKLPVMVFIHGGAYMSGSGDSDTLGPEFLLQHDVILVTINYRLEVLGFLCLDTPEVPGNAGLRDQVAALRWIQDNIAEFGGDPNNVTIFGESAGAASVTFHMHSQMSKGLFSKAIAQSGVSICDWAQGKEGKDRAFRAAKYLGNDCSNTKQVLDFLSSVPAEKLSKLTMKTLTDDEKFRGLPIHFAPVVEKKFDSVEPFLTDEAVDSLCAGHMNKVPLMLGYNSNEALLMITLQGKKGNIDSKYFVPREIKMRVSDEKTKQFGDRIKNFYTRGKDFSEMSPQILSNMLSDVHFTYNIHRYADLYHRFANTYLYEFNCDTELNVIKRMMGYMDLKGACHADDLFYIFHNLINKDAYDQNPKLKDIVFRVAKLWTDFAKTGNPTPDNSLGTKWLPYTKSNKAYLEIDEKLTPGVNLHIERVDFWNKLYSEVGLPCISKSNL